MTHAIQESRPNSDASLYPKLRIHARDSVWVKNEEYIAQSRHGDKWAMLKLATNESIILSDNELFELYGAGELKWRSRPSLNAPLSPLAPQALSENANCDAMRKHDYVQYVSEHADGYRCSKPWIKERIDEKADLIGDKNPPSSSSVLNWKKLHDAHYAEIGLAAYAARHDLKGKRGSRLPEISQEAIERALDRYSQGGSVVDAHVEAEKFIFEFNQSAAGKKFCKTALPKFLTKTGTLASPSLSTLRREISQKVSPYVAEAGRVGKYSARKKFQTYQTRSLPERPYAEVEVDFTPMDVLLVAENGAHLGRPSLVVFLDRATRMVLGFSVSFDVPTYAAVIGGIKHATYRKEISHIDGLKDEDWPCMGRIERLYIDNGLEFANTHLRTASAQLGFEIVRLPPREPWLKGLVERFMREAAKFAHRLPGTTHSNAVDHRQYEEPEPPVLTMTEFRDMVTKWIVTDYNASPNRALGRVPGVSRSPIDAWRDKLDTFDLPILPDKKLFIALAGEHEERTVQKYGVEWDHIRYWTPELDRILTHPSHRAKSSSGRPAKYQVHRDPYDLSKVYLHSGDTDPVIELPAVQKWAEYTRGLTVHQHRLCRQHELVREEQRSDPIALMKAKAAIIEAGLGVLKSGTRKKLERNLVRFLYGDRAQLLHADVAQGSPQVPGHEPMPLSPLMPTPALIVAERYRENRKSAVAPDPQVAGPTSTPVEDDMDEIEKFASEMKSGVRTDD
ncbi:Mu transposase C-terminal domain-containing protein [Erythrobacter crassostreae]|uniref:Transposase n=1 Tax=Erythrobacter crassostreae TaxID=2828328 RepID=A0A9X1F400_9SPHN|nr:Mu transposase C-terminal domain-containing protein [Erythrobacter crassostrea]MBV7259354.1 transposase [Erythrobacter crassostrea]